MIPITAEKDVSTELTLLGDPNDDEVDFVEVYGRPVYVLRNLSGKPTSLMRLGYPEDETDQYYNVEYPQNSTEALPLHQHYNEQFFEDDDFFEINNQTEDFQKLMNNYTFALSFTGRRWYGKLLAPDRYSGNFKEEEYHALLLGQCIQWIGRSGQQYITYQCTHNQRFTSWRRLLRNETPQCCL